MTGRGIWNVKLWIGAGLLFWILNAPDGTSPRSPYWFSELALYALMMAGIWANHRRFLKKRLRLSTRVAPLAYVVSVWALGMVFETSLTIDGTGIGGVHQDTAASFAFAQGDYVMIAIVSWLVVRRWHLHFHTAFFLAGGKALTEGLIFTGALTETLLSPAFVLAPIVLAYYTLVYASFIATPLLFLDEELLWRGRDGHARAPSLSIPRCWLLGFVLAFGIRIVWAFVYIPIVQALFDFAPNVAG